jgi:hypothetical protein
MIIYSCRDRTPYTYLIGWSKHNKYYYGRRTAKKCHPSELWVKYFTSSHQVYKFRQIYGEPDIIQIRRTFDSIVKCCSWEEKVLARLNVKDNSTWLNLTGKYAFYGVSQPWNVGIPHSEETKNKISKQNSGRKFSSEINSKKVRKGEKNGMYGVRRYGKDSPHYGKKHSEETRKLLKEASSKFREVKFLCPHCNKSGDKQNMMRWHFDNCRKSDSYKEKTTWGRVCRLADKKEMDPGNWAIYMKSFNHS